MKNYKTKMFLTVRMNKCLIGLSCLAALVLMGAGCMSPKLKVQARYWTGTNDLFVDFPEQDPANHVWQDLTIKTNLGLCFSGGGTRSASASVGELRALQKLGVLEKVRYAAAASGGAWALVPYTYISDNALTNFLEPYVPPASLTNVSNMKPGAGSLTEAISKANVTLKGLGHLARFRGAEEYARTVSDCLLSPFKLGDPNKWFTWNAQTAKEILDRNTNMVAKGWGGNYQVTPGRPYPIVGGTIRFFDILPSATSQSLIKRIPVEYTPLYSGARQWWPPNHYMPAPVGGGYVESFAYDTIQPTNRGNGLAEAWLYDRWPWNTSPVFNLGDMIGSSGAAPGEYSFAVETLGFPKFNNWSPKTLKAEGTAKDWRYDQEDGGLSENLAIMPLLARQVPAIIAFANAQEKVIVGNGPCVFPDYVEGLFGRTKEGIYSGTQVFAPEELDKIGEEVERCIRAGKPAVVLTTLEVKPNSRFGVSAYKDKVKILWFFLDAQINGTYQMASENWKSQIPTNTTPSLMLEDFKGPLKDFPNYRTFAETRGLHIWPIIQLSGEQTTMLAHYAAWSVMESTNEINALMK